MSVESKRITVAVEVPVKYKAVTSGGNVLVLEAYIDPTFYPITVLDEASRTLILNAITESVRIEEYEAMQDLADFDNFLGRKE